MSLDARVSDTSGAAAVLVAIVRDRVCADTVGVEVGSVVVDAVEGATAASTGDATLLGYSVIPIGTTSGAGTTADEAEYAELADGAGVPAAIGNGVCAAATRTITATDMATATGEWTRRWTEGSVGSVDITSHYRNAGAETKRDCDQMLPSSLAPEALDRATHDAKDNVARFRAARDKLTEAAQVGQVTKMETHVAAVEASRG